MTLQIIESNARQIKLTDWLVFETNSDIQSLDIYGVASGIAAYVKSLCREYSDRKQDRQPVGTESPHIDALSLTA